MTRPNLPNRELKRPTFAEVFADESLEEVLFWIAGLDRKLATDIRLSFIEGLPKEEEEMRRLLVALAHGAGASPLTMLNNLQSTLEWPVDDDLYEIFKLAIKRVEGQRLRERTIEWVMASGTRINSKVGDEIGFMDGTYVRRHGKVVSIDRPTASAIVVVNDNKFVAYAERVVA